MKIVFTKHAQVDKFKMLSKHNFHLTKAEVISVIKHPDNIDKETDYPNLIASKEIDKKHILRVVHKIENGIITIITFYPAEKGRYY